MKRPAFQFYPTDWVGSRWVSYEDASMAAFPRKPACYVIYLDGQLSYVGQTTDLAKRMSMHGIRMGYGASVLTRWGPYRSVAVKSRFGVRYGDWAMREARLIHRLQPALNTLGVRAKKAGGEA